MIKCVKIDVFIALSSRRWEYHVGSLYFSAAQILQHALSFLKVFGYYSKAAISLYV